MSTLGGVGIPVTTPYGFAALLHKDLPVICRLMATAVPLVTRSRCRRPGRFNDGGAELRRRKQMYPVLCFGARLSKLHSRTIRSKHEEQVVSEQKTSAAVWLFGCLGAGVLGLIVCGGGLYFLAQQGMESLGDAIEREAERSAFADTWQPPAQGTTGDALFPEMVEGFRRSGAAGMSARPEFGIEEEFGHATYAGPLGTVNVYIAETGSAPDSYFEALKTSIEDAKYSSRATTHVGPRWYFYVDPPEQTGWMWSLDGWLVLVVADGKYDPEPFLRAYLTAIAGEESVAAPAEVPESSDTPVHESAEPAMENENGDRVQSRDATRGTAP